MIGTRSRALVVLKGFLTFPLIGEWLFVLFRWTVISLWFLFAAVPLVWLFINSIKMPLEWLAIPPVILPSKVTFQNYAELFLDPSSDALLCLKNSVVITLVATTLSVFIGSLGAYSLTHLQLPYRLVPIMSLLVLLMGFYPRIITVIPYFVIMKNLGLIDTQIAVIIAFVGLNLPRTVWVMMTFYAELPREIEQSAMLDGCGPWRRFQRIVVPITLPGMAVAAILCALACWVEFMIAASVTVVHAKTLTIAVSAFLQDKGMHWGPMSALGTVTVVPVIFFCLFVQRYLVRGLTFGAIKG
ncbi:MAG: carbohydrate ABC transporter permease [Anaerolineae bacterium]